MPGDYEPIRYRHRQLPTGKYLVKLPSFGFDLHKKYQIESCYLTC